MMGCDPLTIDRMTVAQFAAMAEGFRRFNSAKAEINDDVTDQEFRAALAEESAAGRLRNRVTVH